MIDACSIFGLARAKFKRIPPSSYGEFNTTPINLNSHRTIILKAFSRPKSTTMTDIKASKYYPAEDDLQMKKARKTAHPTKYRESLQPGTVLILLAGRFRGKRVVLLRHLSQGVLLITGPYKSNGVPLRRVNHRYVIATSTVVDVTGIDAAVLDKVSKDEYWAREKDGKSKGEDDFFKEGEVQKKEVDPERAEDQKTVDRALIANIKKVADLEQYLRSDFSLRSNERPHEMVF